MKDHVKELELQQRDLAVGVWENEGGAPQSHTLRYQYGKRIEGDRTWTVYHVFTGKPAYTDGGILTGLTRLEAIESIMALN